MQDASELVFYQRMKAKIERDVHDRFAGDVHFTGDGFLCRHLLLHPPKPIIFHILFETVDIIDSKINTI